MYSVLKSKIYLYIPFYTQACHRGLLRTVEVENVPYEYSPHATIILHIFHCEVIV